jgi:hypothetical protein
MKFGRVVSQLPVNKEIVFTTTDMDTPDARTAVIPTSPHPIADAKRTKIYSPSCPSDQSPAITGYEPPNASTPTSRLLVEAETGNPRIALPSETAGYQTMINPIIERKKSRVADSHESNPFFAVAIPHFPSGPYEYLWSVVYKSKPGQMVS